MKPNLQSKYSSHAGVQDSVSFVQSAVTAGAHVLDVGCGDGLLALALEAAGYRVTAIDASEKAIAEARANGLNAEQAEFLEYSGGPFDAILFSRSLHHIHPVKNALAKAESLLTASGVIVLEEFGADLMDKKSALWFYGMKSFVDSGDTPIKSRGPHDEHGQIPDNRLEHWHEHHFGKHEISTSEELIQEFSARFPDMQPSRVPFLYRYFLDDVTAEQGQRLLAWETALCAEGIITPIGIRMVGKR
jgi:2-polyprenyl-3-methyl-5-hydroxy-6-metoxy-1,4-benzoquinol methylase